MLKNFSSLKAIISALNSNSIYRLSKIWEVLPKERVSCVVSYTFLICRLIMLLLIDGSLYGAGEYLLGG